MGKLRLAGIASAVLIAAQAQAADPIEVIAAFSLTGNQSALDVAAYDGAALAVDLINRDGGIDGRPIALIAVDTESRVDLVESKIGAALADHPVAIAGIGYSYSTEALHAGRLFQAAGLPFISSGATDPAVPQEVGDDLFYAAYGDDAQAEAMAAFVRDELKLGRAAVWIDESRLYTRTIGKFFQESFKRRGGTIDLVRSDKDTSGYIDFLDRLKTMSPPPEVIYAATQPASGATIIDQTRAAGIDVPLLSGDGWDDEAIVEASKRKALDEIYFTTHSFIGVDTPAMTAFVGAFTAKYDHAPTNAFAPLGFDTVNLLADAIRRAGSLDPASIRDALASTTAFEGVVGTIAYRPGKRVPVKAVPVIALDKGVETRRWLFTPN